VFECVACNMLTCFAARGIKCSDKSTHHCSEATVSSEILQRKVNVEGIIDNTGWKLRFETVQATLGHCVDMCTQLSIVLDSNLLLG